MKRKKKRERKKYWVDDPLNNDKFDDLLMWFLICFLSSRLNKYFRFLVRHQIDFVRLFFMIPIFIMFFWQKHVRFFFSYFVCLFIKYSLPNTNNVLMWMRDFPFLCFSFLKWSQQIKFFFLFSLSFFLNFLRQMIFILTFLYIK